MNGQLRTTLDDLLASGSEPGPALQALIDSYTTYHVVFVAVGGLFTLAFAVLAVVSWRRLRRVRRSDRRWTFERFTYLCFAISSAALTLMMGLLVAANLSNTVDPQRGFEGAVGMIGPQTGPRSADLQQSFTTWLRSGTAEVPAGVRGAIDDRLAWQRPKAIICSVLLVGLVLLSAAVWRSIVRRAQTRHGDWRPRDVASLAVGVALGPVCLLLMVMVIGNTQAAIAPLSMTLFYG